MSAFRMELQAEMFDGCERTISIDPRVLYAARRVSAVDELIFLQSRAEIV